jgi:hypothetical protein
VPKRLEEINYFRSGVVYTPDDRDIPNDAASYSLNVDPQLDNGSIKGIPTDKTVEEGVDSIGMEIITDGATKRLVYMDSDGDIHKVDDVEASNPDNEVQLEAGTYTNPPAMVVNNKEVHIGLGDSNDSKWVGIIPHGQFSGSAPSGLQIADAKLTEPSSFSDLHKVVTDDTYIYGIEYGGQTLYRFKINDQSITKSKPVFKNEADLTAIALASDGNIWILDSTIFSQGSNIIGVLYKVDSTSLEVIQENKLSLGSLTTATKYSDLLEVGAELWVSAEKTSLATSVEKAHICNITTPTSDGDLVVTNRMPLFRTETSTVPEGKFDTDATSGGDDVLMTCFIPSVNLVKLKDSNDHCGLAIDIRDPYDGGLAKFQYGGGGSDNKTVSSCIAVIHKSCDSTSHTLSGNNKLLPFYNQSSAHQIFTDNTINKGYVTSDGENYIGISFYSASDSADDTFINKITIPDMDTVSNGDVLQSYGSIESNITNAIIAIVDRSGSYDFHFFSSGDSVGRWSKHLDVASSISAGNVSVVLQSDAYINLALATATGTSSSFTANKNYFYKLSYIYDGYQESPLSSDFMISQSSTAKQVSVTVNLFNTASISKRITHINVYMAEGDEDSSDPTGFYRLVKSIGVNDRWLNVADDTTSPDWGVKKTYQFLHNGNISASYESRTGISEVLTNFTPKYTLNTALNNHHFVANCSHTDLDNASLYLFKSRPYNYDQFNWAYDFLVLPQQPTAIKGFNGRIYAFTTSSIYKIEPNNMYIEDIYEGAGCLTSQSVIVTDDGMFFADDRNIYQHNGTTLTPLADPILNLSDSDVESAPNMGRYGTSWQSRIGSTQNVVLGYDNKRRTLLAFFDVAYNYSGVDYTFNLCWAYTISQKRWDLWEAPIVKSYVSGTDGQNFVSNGTNLYNYLYGTSTRSWKWYSKKITMNASTVDKKFIKMHEESDTGTPTVTVATNDAPTTYASLSAIRKAKWIRIKAVAASSTDRLNSVGIQWRQLRETPITDP